MRLKRVLRDNYIFLLIIAIGVVFAYAVTTYEAPVYHTCVLEDTDSNYIEIEVGADEAWNQIIDMHNLGTRRFVGGKLVDSDNQWGFTFDPETIIVADFVAEGLETTLQFIKDDPDYWFNMGICYISAKVIGVKETT